MKYAIVENGVVTNIVVSDDPELAEDRGWIEAEGGVSIGWTYSNGQFEEVEPQQPVPVEVTPMRAKLALYAAGLYSQVEAAVAASAAPVQIAWNNATAFRRDDPFVLAIGQALNLTSDQIDDLFRNAATLTTG